MNTTRITIKRLPFNVMQPYHPMYGLPQKPRFVYRIRVNGNITRSGVTNSPSTIEQ